MKRKHLIMVFTAVFMLACSGASVSAHFGMVIPSDSMVMQHDERSVELNLSFSHPFEGIGMEMAKPRRFAAVHKNRTTDLTGGLEPTRVMGEKAWKITYPVKRPGVYNFVMTPQPYWEPAEDVFIIHYTKTVVTAFGDDSQWDAEVGLPTEIVPLAKPFAQYAGNVFQAVVKLNGAPVPYAAVEVEYYNRGGSVSAPSDYMICQTIKADQNGVFTYAAPAPGWWGFSALNTADYKIEKNGEQKAVELGAVIWVKFHPWQVQ